MPDEEQTMTLQFHPRMQVDGTMSPSQPEQPESTSEEVTPPAQDSGTPTEPAEEPEAQGTVPPPTAENVDDGYYKLSKTDLYNEIRRIAKSDADFNRRIREFAGRSTRHELNEELNRLKAENARKDRELRRREIAEMSPEEREEKFKNDPDFAREYTEFIHPDESNIPDPNVESEASYYEMTRDELLDDARDVQMPEWRVKQFEDAFSFCPLHKTDDHGFYDHDAQGNFFDQRFKDPAMARKASFDFFQRTLNAEIRNLQAAILRTPPATPKDNRQEPPPTAGEASPPSERGASPEPSAPSSAGAANPSVQRAGPDPSPRSSGGSPKARYTDDDLRAMGVDARIKLVEELGGRKKMIEDGVLYVPGLSEEVHGQALPR